VADSVRGGRGVGQDLVQHGQAAPSPAKAHGLEARVHDDAAALAVEDPGEDVPRAERGHRGPVGLASLSHSSTVTFGFGFLSLLSMRGSGGR
jgi:hypothetical protein